MAPIISNIIDIIAPTARMKRLITIMFIAISGSFLGAILVINEISKKDIKQSQLQIEKDRITQIDKQLTSVYKIIYTSNDTVNNFNNKKYLDEVTFLKSQRAEAIKNIDNVNSDPNSEILLFTGIASALVIALITFFSISFRTDFDLSQNENYFRASRRQRAILDDYNYNFLSWVTSQGLSENENSNINIIQAKLLKSIYDKTAPVSDRESLLKEILRYGRASKQLSTSADASTGRILFHFKEAKARLIEECNRLNKQGLINLFICFVVAFLIIGFIAYNSIYSNEVRGITELHTFLIKYLPRLVSILGLVTIFLYFIKLYKENILNVKYYQNELTNIELKLIALHTALERGNNESIIALISSYSATERNNSSSLEVNSFDSKAFKDYGDTAKDIIVKLSDILTSIKKKE